MTFHFSKKNQQRSVLPRFDSFCNYRFLINSARASSFSTIVKIAKRPTYGDSVILGGSKMDRWGLRARCENKLAKIHRIDFTTLRAVPWHRPVTLQYRNSFFSVRKSSLSWRLRTLFFCRFRIFPRAFIFSSRGAPSDGRANEKYEWIRMGMHFYFFCVFQILAWRT